MLTVRNPPAELFVTSLPSSAVVTVMKKGQFACGARNWILHHTALNSSNPAKLVGRRRRKQVSLIDKEPDTRGSSAWTVGVHAEALCVLRKERIRQSTNFAAKTERFNLSTSVQKSVQLALQKRGQGTRPYPPFYGALELDTIF